MTSSNSGAVFFLGSRAHYQVLQQPESQSHDTENGNASTETIYRNPSARELTDNAEYGERNWNYEHDTNMTEDKEKLEIGNGVKRRTKRHQSETTLCEKDNDMKPALLNNVGDSSTPKAKARRRLGIPLFLLSLGRRRHEPERAQYLQHIESALACTYRGSCRCLDCQSRYFECDESEDESSEDSEYSAQYQPEPVSVQQCEDDDDDEVFIETPLDDSTSCELLLSQEPVPRVSPASPRVSEEDDDMQLEVAAGTPVLLNYLLTHPVTCSVQ